MNDLIFGNSKSEQTIIVFTIVLLSLTLVPLFYFALRPSALDRLQKRSVWKDWRFLIPMLTYVILLGFRYNYYYDWDQFRNIFVYLQKGLLYREDAEIGYLFINKLLILCGFNYYSIFILEGVVYIFSYYFLLKDYRRYLPFILPLVFMGQNINCLNISRQFFAMSVLFIAYRFLLDKKRWLFGFISIGAGLIHASAFLWFPVFYVFSKFQTIRLNYTFISLIVVGLSLGIFLFKDILYEQLQFIFGLFSFKENYRDVILADKRVRETMSFDFFLVRLVKMLTYIYVFKIQDKTGIFKEHPMLRNFILIGIVSMPIVILFSANELFLRTFFYISVFTDIGWGILIYNMCFLSRKIRYNPIVMCLVCICVFHYYWSFYSNIITSFSNKLTNPYILYR